MFVYVLDIDGNPLMPTKRFGHVRRMLKSGKAVVVNLCPFVIQLTYDTTNYVQPITLGVDTGSVHVGLSASTQKEELFAAESKLRSKDIKKLLEDKNAACGTRRYRLWYRLARFNNRVSTKKKGWLAPSIRHRIESHKRLVEMIMKILPISDIRIEVASFDTQKIENLDISGKEYQNGETKGFYNIKSYVRARDKNMCQQCKSKDHIEIHHIQHKEDGGSDRPNNLICLCHDCHYAHHHKGLVLKNFKNVDRKKGNTLADAAAMNVFRYVLLDELREMFSNIPVRITFGYITWWNRVKYKIKKSHASDAFVISKNFNAKPLDCIYKGIQVRRHNRKIHKDKILKGGRRQNHQAKHFIHGFALNDRVRFNGIECFVHGRRTSGQFVLTDIDGTIIHGWVVYKKIKRIKYERSMIFKLVKIKKVGADSSSEAKDPAVSSAQIL